MIKDRYLTKHVIEDLSKKMVFVGGPRQVGKTTLAKELVASHFDSAGYLNWDRQRDRKTIIKSRWPGDAELIILDEIHKYKKWKSFLKGEYDTLKDRYQFLITGSARLDVYRKGGDSMMGRYHYYRLHPFSIAELNGKSKTPPALEELPIPSENNPEIVEVLDKFGGFPEPFLKQNARTLRRWHNEKNTRLFREDIRDIELVRDLSAMQLLGDMLPERAGSMFSINSVREDLEISHRTASNWLDILESFYYCYRIYPYTSKAYKSLKKEPKLYLWDWSEVEGEAARFENFIGSHLIKLCHFLHDYEGYRADVYYLRSIEKKEVDFLVTIDKKPWFAVEVKLTNTNIARNLLYFKNKLDIPFSYQVVKPSGIDSYTNGVRIVSADRFLLGLI